MYKLKCDITEEKYNELYNDDQYLNTMQKYEELCNFFYDAFSEFKDTKDNVFFGGKTNILKQPEYNEPEKIG